ncbi:hypothetical protein CSAL01_13654 [Colletotrichum salicis]|uniref:Uncharacterized protein n=1 Tax=Colletotrichum salicis TaxID=1209931 RepID=A0A135SKU0_9PEZI|nr:hypothetical protein CSAL01_13654 [Colletotrichum salicis]
MADGTHLANSYIDLLIPPYLYITTKAATHASKLNTTESSYRSKKETHPTSKEYIMLESKRNASEAKAKRESSADGTVPSGTTSGSDGADPVKFGGDKGPSKTSTRSSTIKEEESSH